MRTGPVIDGVHWALVWGLDRWFTGYNGPSVWGLDQSFLGPSLWRPDQWFPKMNTTPQELLAWLAGSGTMVWGCHMGKVPGQRWPVSVAITCRLHTCPMPFVTPSLNRSLVPGFRYSGCLIKRKRTTAFSPVRSSSWGMEEAQGLGK